MLRFWVWCQGYIWARGINLYLVISVTMSKTRCFASSLGLLLDGSDMGTDRLKWLVAPQPQARAAVWEMRNLILG